MARVPPVVCARAPVEAEYRPFSLRVLRVEGDELAEVTSSGAPVCPGFGLPAALDAHIM